MQCAPVMQPGSAESSLQLECLRLPKQRQMSHRQVNSNDFCTQFIEWQYGPQGCLLNATHRTRSPQPHEVIVQSLPTNKTRTLILGAKLHLCDAQFCGERAERLEILFEMCVEVDRG